MEWLWDCLSSIGFDFGFGDGVQVEGSFNKNVCFDASLKGSDIKISADKMTVSGDGSCLVKTALHQDRVYFEVLVTKAGEGKFRVGVCRVSGIKDRKDALNDLLGEEKLEDVSWALKSEQSTTLFAEGDTIGVTYDQSSGRPTLEFYHNGDKMPGCSIAGLSGLVCPAVGVTDGVELTGNFSMEEADFEFMPPQGFSGIIPSRSMI
mmetsp:Transcript_4650/g.5252  ORF Transcript_4650/g.5252 Transcript_4650/m.5252 type:complete len:206 (-) Transcript_4650:95-712(-)